MSFTLYCLLAVALSYSGVGLDRKPLEFFTILFLVVAIEAANKRRN